MGTHSALLLPPCAGNSAFKSPDAFKVSLPLRTNYLYGKVRKTLPELYAFTVCLWLRSSASPGIGTPFSYAVPGQTNEIVLIEWGNNPIELLINDKVRLLQGQLMRNQGWEVQVVQAVKLARKRLLGLGTGMAEDARREVWPGATHSPDSPSVPCISVHQC